MGACTFRRVGYGKTAQEAFCSAVQDANMEVGHQDGYSGDINSKHGFIVLDIPEGVNLRDFIYDMEDDHDEIRSKWGPAGCIKMEEGKYIFFGYAPS
jgi:hypothetical protein